MNTFTVENFELDGRRMKEWARVPIGPTDVPELIEKLPQVNDKLYDYFTARFVRQDEHNLWGLFNCLTAWATHGETTKLPAHTAKERQERVAKLVNTGAWQLAA